MKSVFHGLYLGAVGLGCVVFSTGAALAQSDAPATFHNPILWEDLADVDIIRVGDTYYYSASNMHYSPGAPLLRSKDLVNWEYIGHSVPSLDFGPQYNMEGGTAYVGGTWASFLGYRQSNKTFYWGGCVNFKHTYIYTAQVAEGPWKKSGEIDNCYYDAGLLIDDDDTMYVAYGNTTLKVAQLSPDGTKEVRSETVFQTPKDIRVLEGSRFYKVNGNYYIFPTRPANGQYVLRSTKGPFGPYEIRNVVLDEKSPVAGAGAPHQGGMVQTPEGKWYYMAFTDAYPGGRIPVLAPVTWKDGWPEVDLKADNQWGESYPMPFPGTVQRDRGGFSDRFAAKELGPEWEWNHNPDNTKWSAGDGLVLKTATVTDDIYLARNTLTHRTIGPHSTATVLLDYSKMKDGDLAGLAFFRNWTGLIGVSKEAGGFKLVMKNGMALDQHKQWTTASKGEVKQSTTLKGGKVWLRAAADVRPGAGRKVLFSYSTDGKSFKSFGDPFDLSADWPFFMAYRFSIFNYATKSLGGEVKVTSFEITKP
ncbi:beta-xylosidase [Rhizomicrobium palustre]|uniref:Beta-xylosidase n=1 Tax=Rhizomicrobium palustre TaxID=189966 RepID=A0A846N1C5_9PROT|nr:glycoside hydrolase 43 family protein [Rhizomicrobium palustre]NIK89131.1 beta-xylosidase [Rhizomicrobium palustre]